MAMRSRLVRRIRRLVCCRSISAIAVVRAGERAALTLTFRIGTTSEPHPSNRLVASDANSTFKAQQCWSLRQSKPVRRLHRSKRTSPPPPHSVSPGHACSQPHPHQHQPLTFLASQQRNITRPNSAGSDLPNIRPPAKITHPLKITEPRRNKSVALKQPTAAPIAMR
jgi:hypothetical protein